MRLPSALAAVAAALLVLSAAPADRTAPRVTVSDPAQYVNPYVGTKAATPDFGDGGGGGNTFPGAAAPLGMVQFSPDTAATQNGGYDYNDHRITGFSLTHLSGAGCAAYGTAPFLPVLDGKPVDHADFSHADESLAPGSYAVTFANGLRTELAATQRTAIARFSYPAGHRASLTVDAGRAAAHASGALTVGGNSISGHTDSGGFCGARQNHYRVYFHAEFDRPFRRVGAKSDSRALISFDTGADQAVTARIGLSFVSADGARANLAAEQQGASLEQIRSATRAAWNGLLGRIAVDGGSTAQRRMFYTALYHALLHPSVLSDHDGRYPAFDGSIRTARPGHTQYADFSGWDVYRSQVQLLALLAPDRASDIAQSVLDQGVFAGWFDRWTLANSPSGVMTGDPLPIIAASVYAFGATDFDARALLKRAVAGRTDSRERPGHADYDRLGYLPTDGSVGGSVSTTLEYAAADFALSQLAARVGDSATHDTLLRASANWRQLMNGGYLQPRNRNGTRPGFDPTQQQHYVEGNATQYAWLVPWDRRGLFDAMGGDRNATSRLDSFFTELNAGPGRPYAYLGNEPSLNTPWAYAYAGRPDRTQDTVRRALTQLYSDQPDGEPGNDDLGEMSSWVVWSALGLYPQVPGRAELVLSSPLFPAATIQRGNGVTIDITAGSGARYINALSVNGAPTQRPWLPEDFIATGGTLAFTLGDDPTPWGGAPEDAPPSFRP